MILRCLEALGLSRLVRVVVARVGRLLGRDPTRIKRRRFPDGFLWGTATASYQVEGATSTDGRTPSTWDVFCAAPGKIFNGDSGKDACKFYHKYPQDIALAARAGGRNPSFRFSISWSRVIPEKGKINQQGLDFYSSVVDEAIRAGVTPVVTLFHWDTPQWCQEEYGGWKSPHIIEDFMEFAEAVFSTLAHRVPYWITLNEPWITANFGYGTGTFAPGEKDTDGRKSYLVAHHQLLAHAAACQLFRAKYNPEEDSQIGIALNCLYHAPANPRSASDKEAAQRGNEFELGWFADPLYFGDYPKVMRERAGRRMPVFSADDKKLLKAGRPDFFALNHYTSRLCSNAPGFPLSSKPGEPPSYFSDAGVAVKDVWMAAKADPEWLHMVPWGLRDVLVWIHDRYGAPKIMITENGCACPNESNWQQSSQANDVFRQKQILSYINATWEAINVYGVDVIGYTYWSLLDNFEWADGYKYRFGLVHVDYDTPGKVRQLKDSFKLYQEISDSNSVAVAPVHGPAPYWPR